MATGLGCPSPRGVAPDGAGLSTGARSPTVRSTVMIVVSKRHSNESGCERVFDVTGVPGNISERGLFRVFKKKILKS